MKLANGARRFRWHVGLPRGCREGNDEVGFAAGEGARGPERGRPRPQRVARPAGVGKLERVKKCPNPSGSHPGCRRAPCLPTSD